MIVFATESADQLDELLGFGTISSLGAVADRRAVYTDEVMAGAIYFGTPLSLEYLLDRLTPMLEAASDGKAPRAYPSSSGTTIADASSPACPSSPSHPSSPPAAATARVRPQHLAAGAPSAAPEEAAFPVTIKHKYGETTIEKAPERVVCLGLTDQDTLMALGVVPVGVTYWFGDEELGHQPVGPGVPRGRRARRPS